jgi:hypothetical protein
MINTLAVRRAGFDGRFLQRAPPCSSAHSSASINVIGLGFSAFVGIAPMRSSVQPLTFSRARNDRTCAGGAHLDLLDDFDVAKRLTISPQGGCASRRTRPQLRGFSVAS